MSDAPERVRLSTSTRWKSPSLKRSSLVKTDAVLLAEFEAMMKRSSKKIAELNANMDALLVRLRSPHLDS